MTTEVLTPGKLTAAGVPLLSAEGVCKNYELPGKQATFTVLEDISLSVCRDEFVALLGRSGCGKSTLLRILAGLLPPSKGTVCVNGQPLRGINTHVAMVFQSFALLPWLTVQENVELGLRAQAMPQKERRELALKTIDMVGLDGFESAYPKELSGGMQQRVGFARAFVLQPEVLLMDEPFSALDVLTAENLRGEIADLWAAGTFPAQSVLMVTHNIEEAVFLADRVLLLATNPGRLRGEIVIDLPRPRDRATPEFRLLVDRIYTAMTHPELEIGSWLEPAELTKYRPLPHARAGGISGLLELLVEQGGEADVAELARNLHLQVKDLLPILDAAVQLGFGQVVEGDAHVTEIGRSFADADPVRSKEIFRGQVLEHAPLVTTILEMLQARPRGVMRQDFILDVLDEHYPQAEAERQFATAVDWGRYAELFEFDADEGLLRLT